MKIEYGPEFEKSMRKMIWFQRTRYINLRQIAREIKWFWQRGRRGYSDRDLWNANDHIAKTVIAFAEFESKYGHSYPMGFGSEERWHETLAEIAWYMGEMLDDSETPFEVMTSEIYMKRFKKAGALFSKWWPSMWD